MLSGMSLLNYYQNDDGGCEEAPSYLEAMRAVSCSII